MTIQQLTAPQGFTIEYRECKRGRRFMAVALDEQRREIGHSVVKGSRFEALRDLTRRLKKEGKQP